MDIKLFAALLGKKNLKNAIEERITAIMKMKKTSIAVLVVAVLLIGGVTTVFATSAKAANKNNTPQAYEQATAITEQEQADIDKQKTEELIEQFAVYKDYGLTYDPKTDNLYYDGKLVRWFADKINADKQYVAAVRDNDGIDLRAVRNTDYELTGITMVSQEEYDQHTQSIKRAQSTSGAY